jgi:hypothetical protein
MNRSLLARLDRLESATTTQGKPLVILSTVPLSENPTAESVAQWVKEGLAHPHAGTDHIVIYDGGLKPMTTSEWERTYANIPGVT